jgi:hypothetical protein
MINISNRKPVNYMNNIYYMIWSDAILSFKKHHPAKKDWKTTLLLYISWIHAINWWIVFIWLKFFDILNVPLISINVFPGTLLDNFFAFTIEFALPFGLLNYFLVFHNNRYEKITQKYRGIKTRYAPIYSFTIAILAFISAIIYGILS